VDVYAFAVLAWELWWGRQPYVALGLTDVDLLARVAGGLRPGQRLDGAAEELPAGVPRMPAALVELLEQCWQLDAACRPTVVQVRERLSAANGACGLLADEGPAGGAGGGGAPGTPQI
jgi:hypothetical protein